jgi:hypothetical protein
VGVIACSGSLHHAILVEQLYRDESGGEMSSSTCAGLGLGYHSHMHRSNTEEEYVVCKNHTRQLKNGGTQQTVTKLIELDTH